MFQDELLSRIKEENCKQLDLCSYIFYQGLIFGATRVTLFVARLVNLTHTMCLRGKFLNHKGLQIWLKFL